MFPNQKRVRVQVPSSGFEELRNGVTGYIIKNPPLPTHGMVCVNHKLEGREVNRFYDEKYVHPDES